MSNALHLAGSLGLADLPDLLQWLASSRQSGTLVVTRDEPGRRLEKRIVFADGRIVSTASTDPKEYLGHFLVSHGFLDEEALARAMEMQRSNRMLLGKILVTLGTIDQRDLEAMLRLKAEESIYEIFTWQGVAFEFHAGQVPDLPMVPLSLSAEELVLEGARRVDDWLRIRQAIPSPHCVPVAIGELVLPPDDPAAARILSLVDDDRTVEEIALSSHASELVVGRVLHDQIQRHRLKVVRPRLLANRPALGPRTEGSADPDLLLRQARQDLDQGDLVGAYESLRDAGDLRNAASDLQLLAMEAQNRLQGELEASGIRPSAVLAAVADLGQATARGLSAQEGFVMSRIDGRYSVESIVQITPLPPLETQVALWKLLRTGWVRLR